MSDRAANELALGRHSVPSIVKKNKIHSECANNVSATSVRSTRTYRVRVFFFAPTTTRPHGNKHEFRRRLMYDETEPIGVQRHYNHTKTALDIFSRPWTVAYYCFERDEFLSYQTI